MHAETHPTTPKIFYGWFVVAGAFAVTFLGFGCAYTFSAFVAPLQNEFGASRGSVSLVFSLAAFLYFCLGIVSGPLADRVGARALALAGMLVLGLGLAAAGAARTLKEVYLGYGLGVGFGIGLAYVPAVGAVQRWFVRRRGLASGFAVAGIGAGTLAMPSIAAQLIDALGWRYTYLCLGLFAAVAGGSAAILIENDPTSRGLAAEGDAALAQPAGASLGQAVVSRRFVGLYVPALLCSLGVFVPFVHLVPYAVDRGISTSSAALLFGAIGAGSTAGRFFLGGFADRVGRAPSLIGMYAGMAASLFVWAASSAFWALAAFAFAFGLFYGGWVALMPALVTDYFGRRNASGIIGVLYTSAAFGALLGPAAAGFAYDVSRSYTIAILASAGANVAAAAISAAAMRLSPAR